MQLRLSSWLLWLAVTASLPPITSPASSENSFDDQFLQGLQERRQFELATAFCERLLQSQEVSTPRRARLTVELLRLRTEQAAHTVAAKRQPYWDQIERVAGEFLSRYQASPRAVLVEFQAALAHLADGELTRIESEFAADSEQALDRARSQLRKSAEAFERIEQQLATGILTTSAQRGDEGFSRGELRSLQQQVRREAARAFQNQALCYPPESSDRVSALTRALDSLARPLEEISSGDPLAHRLMLDRAICQRLLGNFADANSTLDSLVRSLARGELAAEVAAERIRLAIAAGAPDRVSDISSPVKSADLDFAQLEVLIALWKRDAESDSGQRWRDLAVAKADAIGSEHGGYWQRRADLALVRAGQAKGSGSLAVLERTAADLLAKGQLREALTVYDKAAATARQNEQAGAWFELAYKAALILQRESQFSEAAARLRELALASLQDERQPQAHLVAIANTAEAVRRGESTISDYAALLEEHLAKWPQQPTALTVGLWQGQLLAQRQDWPGAIDVLQSTLDNSTGGNPEIAASAAQTLISCWTRQLEQVAAGELEGESARAIAYFDQLVSSQGTSSWPTEVRLAAGFTARLRLYFQNGAAGVAEQLLSGALIGATEVDEILANKTSLALAIGYQAGRRAESQALLEEVEVVAGPRAQRLCELLQEFTFQVSRRDDSQQASRAAAVLSLADRLESVAAVLSEPQRAAVDRSRARLLGITDPQVALPVYRRLVERQPGDNALRREFAALLLEQSDQTALQEALDQWRLLAGRSATRSQEWFEAKYSVARALCLSGQKQEAAKLIRYLEATEDLKGAGFAARFADLLKLCN